MALFLYHQSCLVCWWVPVLLWPFFLVGNTCVLWLTMQHTKWVSQFVGWTKPYFWNRTPLTVWGFCWLHAHWMQALPAGSLGPPVPWSTNQKEYYIQCCEGVYLFLPRNTHHYLRNKHRLTLCQQPAPLRIFLSPRSFSTWQCLSRSWRTALMGEQPNPWNVLPPQVTKSRMGKVDLLP
jgi:hypothetical protein